MSVQPPTTRVYIELTRLCQTPFTTGIQRVAKEIVLRMLRDATLDVVLLADLPGHTRWRVLPHDAFLTFYTLHTGSPYGEGIPQTLSPFDLSADAVFFDIDSAWNLPMQRGWLFPILKQRGVTIVSHLYDLIPVTHPQFFHKNTATEFLVWVTAVLQSADALICNADATRQALYTLCDTLELPHPRCVVVPLGADFVPSQTADDLPDEELLGALTPHRYLLMVGTIEPRKNHALVLDALPDLHAMGVQVVFAGRIGWNMDAFAKRMKQAERGDNGFFFANSPTDATIQALYDQALAVAFPTQDEGFGLPIIEAFLHGTPVLASDIPVLREVGGTLADYFNHHSTESLLSAVKTLLADANAYSKKRAAIAAFRPRTWDETAADMAAALGTFGCIAGAVPSDTPLRQLVLRTADNDALLRARPYWEAYLPFIEEVVVCGPAANESALRAAWTGTLRLTFCPEEPWASAADLPTDVAAHAGYLDCKMLREAPLDAAFLWANAADCPIAPLTQDAFLANDRYQAFYCHNLTAWTGTQAAYTAEDEQLFRTREFLLANHLPTLCYASHQPQIFSRDLLLELLTAHPAVQEQGLDVQSAYLNYGVAQHRDCFLPLPYCTMGWPAKPTDWRLWTTPAHLTFEHYEASAYAPDGVFAGLSATYAPETAQTEALEKVLRWSRVLANANAQQIADKRWDAAYQTLYHLPPRLALLQTADGVCFSLPKLLLLTAGAWVRLPIAVTHALRCPPEATLEFSIETTDGLVLFPQQTLVLSGVHPDYRPELLLTTPPCTTAARLLLRYTQSTDGIEQSAEIPCVVVNASCLPANATS